MTDAQQLARMIAGDRAALTELYLKHRRAVYSKAFVEVRDRGTAEEILQDAFYLFWVKRSKIPIVGGSTLPWLLVTARNLAANARRARQSREAQVLDDDVPSSGYLPEHAVEHQELAEILRAAVADLSPLDQQIVKLCLVDGLLYKEAATQLGMSHSSVRNRLFRARRSLRASIPFAGGEQQ